MVYVDAILSQPQKNPFFFVRVLAIVVVVEEPSNMIFFSFSIRMNYTKFHISLFLE